MRHEVLYGGGDQTIYHVPRDRDGRAIRAATATYQIIDLTRSEDDSARTVQASGAATVDSVSTTLDGSAGPAQSDAKLIPLTSESGIVVGHTYLITQGELSEAVVIAGVDTGQAYAEHDLVNDYTSGATFQGMELQGTFPTAEAADEDDMEAGGGPYMVIWAYTLAGTLYYAREEIWVLRYSIQPLITAADVALEWPLASSLTRERVKIANAIAAASTQFVAELEAAAEYPERLLHSPLSGVAVRKLAVAYLRRWLPSERNDLEADRLEQAYVRHFNDLVTGVYPSRTAKINQATATADRGGERGSGQPRFRVS